MGDCCLIKIFIRSNAYVMMPHYVWQKYCLFIYLKVSKMCKMTFFSRWPCIELYDSQLRRGYFHQNLNIIGGQSWRWLLLELGWQACQLQWSYWIKAMRYLLFLLCLAWSSDHLDLIETRKKCKLVDCIFQTYL